MSRPQRSKRNGSQSKGSDLLNFHFSTPAPQQTNQSERKASRKSQQHQQQYRRTKEDRASARKKASHKMFYLHSSPDHAFIISRIPPMNQTYTFQGSDDAVSWESVRVVKYLSSVNHRNSTENCPICLDSLSCPRITKCGHIYCLVCLIRHIHVSGDVSGGPTCPCCSIPVHLPDVRPVRFVSVSPVSLGQRITLQKLHRSKECSSPFLPLVDHPRRQSPLAAPCETDSDAAYCRFNFVDPERYARFLQENRQELERLGFDGDHVGLGCQRLAIDYVESEIRSCAATHGSELEYLERFSAPSAGLYAQHPKWLLSSTYKEDFVEIETASLDDPGSPGVSVESPSNCDRRLRGDSIVSQDTVGHHDQSRSSSREHNSSIFLDEGESAFYQTQDGKLCFLSGFNMACLRAEFSPSLTDVISRARTTANAGLPLPDVVKGTVVSIERIHLSPDARQRLRFLAHLPFYSDVTFVELSLNMLSPETKKKFAKEFSKRKQARQKKIQAEKREDERIRRLEQSRIDELKSRMQRIDPNDTFFHIPQEEPTRIALSGESFGPSISSGHNHSGSGLAHDQSTSFSAITRTGGMVPAVASDDANFPSLTANCPAKSHGPTAVSSWGSPKKSSGAPPSQKTPLGSKKKGKQKKVLLFSTGGGNSYGL